MYVLSTTHHPLISHSVTPGELEQAQHAHLIWGWEHEASQGCYLQAEPEGQAI
jgi:hypothetical protein